MSEPTTVFVKRFTEKGAKPPREGLWTTSKGELEYYDFDWSDRGSYVTPPLWFMEEVTLSSLNPERQEVKLPSKEELWKAVTRWRHSVVEAELVHEEITELIKKLNHSLFPSTTKTDKT